MFYNDLDEANKDLYTVNTSTDVCKISGRVNRYSGLRYDSFQLGKEILDSKYHNVTLIPYPNISRDDYKELIETSDLLLVCTGYCNNTVPILYSNGSEMNFLKDDSTILTNSKYNPIVENGEALENFYTFGLGSGLKTGNETGGEPNYKGRIDGVWVYQNEVSPKLVSLIQQINQHTLIN